MTNNRLLSRLTSHLGQSLWDGLAVNGAPGVSAGAGDLGAGSLTQVGSEVVFGLGLSGVDGGALTEKVGNQLFLNRSLLEIQFTVLTYDPESLFSKKKMFLIETFRSVEIIRIVKDIIAKDLMESLTVDDNGYLESISSVGNGIKAGRLSWMSSTISLREATKSVIYISFCWQFNGSDP